MTLSYASPLLDLACAIQQVPAPTFHEKNRADFVQAQLTALGLRDVTQDDLGNVYARRPGGSQRPVLVTAHLDTVFPAGTDLTLTRRPDTVHGPGLGDNSLGVAGLLGLIWALGSEVLPGDLWLAANVCEEGLGDLRGMRRVVDTLGSQVQAIIVLEGMSLGRVVHAGIGVRRYRLTAHTAGGHSWNHFGQPSAIHALMALGVAITQLPVPTSPKTTFNIGTVRGGTSINTIAHEATCDLDLRSEALPELQHLAARVEALVQAHTTANITFDLQVIGERPPGELATSHPLAQLAIRALEAEGVQAEFDNGSTDANIPLSRGLPCVCLGLGRGANAHRLDEYIETRDLDRGLRALTATVRGAYLAR